MGPPCGKVGPIQASHTIPISLGILMGMGSLSRAQGVPCPWGSLKIPLMKCKEFIEVVMFFFLFQEKWGNDDENLCQIKWWKPSIWTTSFWEMPVPFMMILKYIEYREYSELFFGKRLIAIRIFDLNTTQGLLCIAKLEAFTSPARAKQMILVAIHLF